MTDPFTAITVALTIAAGPTEPRLEPEPGFRKQPGIQRRLCPMGSDNPGQVYIYPWINNCWNQEEKEKPDEQVCTMWQSGVKLTLNDGGKQCAQK